MRAFLLVAAGLALGAQARAEEPCEPLPDEPAPPPMTLRPRSAASLQASKRLADPVISERFYFDDAYADREHPHNQVTDWQTRRSVLRLLEAARAEPANVAARTALAGALVRYVGDDVSFCDEPAGKAHDQALIRRWLLATLAQLRDAGFAGCRACMTYLEGFKSFDVLGEHDADMDALEARLSRPEGPVADATRAVVAWFAAEGDAATEAAWKKAEPYVGARKVIRAEHMRVVGRKGLERWFESLRFGLPLPGRTWACDARCCRFAFVDDHPHKLQMTSMCFDAHRQLESIASELSGM